MGQKMLMKGNEAIAEAAIQAGCRFFFGYPITPQNQVPEYMSKRLPREERYRIVRRKSARSNPAFRFHSALGWNRAPISSSW